PHPNRQRRGSSTRLARSRTARARGGAAPPHDPPAHRSPALQRVGWLEPDTPRYRTPRRSRRMTSPGRHRVLYSVICGAGPATRIEEFVMLAQRAGWDVHCIATPAAVEHFIDIPNLERLTGHQVRTAYRGPGDESFPHADSVAVAPATYNTINKWAA